MDNHRNKDASSKLEQIADVLGISKAAFLDREIEALDPTAAAAQEEELLQLFRDIRDPELRERLLAYMRAVVTQAVA